MPYFRGLDVRIITGNEDVPLQEYATQSKNSRHFCSTFIEARTNMSFKIQIKPTIPFLDPDSTDPPQLLTMRPTPGAALKYNATFDLGGGVYFDGATERDRSFTLRVDAKARHFPTVSNGRKCLSSRSRLDAQGKVRKAEWVFREIGIEKHLKGLSVDDEDDSRAGGHRTDVELDDDGHPKFGGGQIKLTFRKRRYFSNAQREAQPRKADPGADPAFDVNGLTHLVDHKVLNKRGSARFVHLDYDYESPETDIPFATFVFRYRDRETLQRILGASTSSGDGRPSAGIPGTPKSEPEDLTGERTAKAARGSKRKIEGDAGKSEDRSQKKAIPDCGAGNLEIDPETDDSTDELTIMIPGWERLPKSFRKFRERIPDHGNQEDRELATSMGIPGWRSLPKSFEKKNREQKRHERSVRVAAVKSDFERLLSESKKIMDNLQHKDPGQRNREGLGQVAVLPFRGKLERKEGDQSARENVEEKAGPESNGSRTKPAAMEFLPTRSKPKREEADQQYQEGVKSIVMP